MLLTFYEVDCVFCGRLPLAFLCLAPAFDTVVSTTNLRQTGLHH